MLQIPDSMDIPQTHLLESQPLYSASGEPYIQPLDTIQEVKEGSVSGDSNGSITPTDATDGRVEDINKPDIFITNDHKVKPDPEKSESRINVQWLSDDDEDDDDDQDDISNFESVHPDIDQGWAWVVLISNFCLFFLQSGLLASTGLYYQQMLVEFGKSRSYTAWLGSMMSALYMLAGPLSAMFIKRVGCRPGIILGSILMTIGYLASAVAKSLPFIFFSYGIVVGTSVILSHCLFCKVYKGFCLCHHAQ